MAIIPMQVQTTVTMQTNTKNQSFLDMHYFLKHKGIKNNDFFLALYDADLMYIDPRDKNLPGQYKIKVLRECCRNFWYFIREVVRIPEGGGAVGDGARYELHRGNLAMNFLFMNNYNIFLELPRQHGKTTAALCYYLWVFNFRATNTDIVFIHQKYNRAKDNLNTLKNLRAALPSYLQMDAMIMPDGTKKKVKNTVESLQHPINNNRIRAMAGAVSETQARNSARGMTVAMQYYDEFAFTRFNKEMYMAAVPAFSKAKQNAIKNGAPYGILITTTPGVLTNDEGKYAYQIRNNATQWNERYYDYDRYKLEELRASNTNSSFFHVIYSYKQLGRNEEYFKNMCIDLENDWIAIRREVLLEWTNASNDCPFSQQDLESIEAWIKKEPRDTIFFGNVGQYQFQVWDTIKDMQYPPIIGVDVAGGYNRDSTAITMIDSKTTKVVGTFNCNYISMPDTAGLVEQLVSNYAPNAIVNIERDGGWGGSVLQMLVKNGKIKRNLYYEIKERVLEERVDMGGSSRHTPATKVREFGISEREYRDRLIEILFSRVKYHKDKFVAPILLDELRTLEYKKNGKVEHASNAHDDTLFSYMLALYVWYDGHNINQWGMYRNPIKTDQETDEQAVEMDKDFGITIDFGQDEETDSIISDQMKELNKHKSMSYKEFRHKEFEKDQKALEKLLQEDPNARKAYVLKNHFDPTNLGPLASKPIVDLDDDVFQSDPWDEKEYSIYQGNLGEQFSNIGDFR